MNQLQRAALEAEAALAKFLLLASLYDSEERTIKSALSIVRSKAQG